MKKKLIGLTTLIILSIYGCGKEDSNGKSSNFTENGNNPIILSKDEYAVNENQVQAFQIEAKDSSNLKYYIFGGDADFFEINIITGEVRFKYPPDYESQTTYQFTVIIEDSIGNRTEQNIKIHILDIDEDKEDMTPPSFNEIKKEITINENERGVFRAIATDDNEVSYEISGGSDASKFVIDERTGVVKFVSSTSYDRQNIYHFTITAIDSHGNEGVQDITVNIDKLPINTNNSYSNYRESIEIGTPTTSPISSTEEEQNVNYSDTNSTELPIYIPPTQNHSIPLPIDEPAIPDLTTPRLIAIYDNYSHVCMGPLNENVLDNDTGLTENVTVTLVTSPKYANTFSLNTDGSFNYTSIMMPSESGNQDSFTYRVTSGEGSAIGIVYFNMNTGGQCQEVVIPSEPTVPVIPIEQPAPIEPTPAPTTAPVIPIEQPAPTTAPVIPIEQPAPTTAPVIPLEPTPAPITTDPSFSLNELNGIAWNADNYYYYFTSNGNFSTYVDNGNSCYSKLNNTTQFIANGNSTYIENIRYDLYDLHRDGMILGPLYMELTNGNILTMTKGLEEILYISINQHLA